MTSLATAFVTIRPDTIGFGTRLSKSVSTEADKAGKEAGGRLKGGMSKALVGMGGLLAGAFTVSKGIDFFKGAIAEATEARKVGAQTAAVLKSTGGAANISAKGISDLAGAISNKTAIDDEAIQSGANLLLTFKNIRNEGGKGNDIFNQTTSIMTDMAAAMGKEPKAAAIQLGKALNDPVKGISALSRVGVTFDESQKKTIKRMVDTGHTMDAQKIILRELNSEFKGSAAAQATPAERAQVAWGNFQELVGTAVLPILDKLAAFLSDKIIPAMSKFVTGMQDGTGAGGKFAAVAVTLGRAIGKVAGFLSDNREAVGAFVAVLGGFMIINKIVKAVAAFNLVLAANPIGIVVVALAALAAGLIYAYKHSETFRKIVDGAFSKVKNAAKAVTDWFKKSFIPFFTTTIPNAFHATVKWVKNNWPVILAIITGPIGLATLFITRHWGTITKAFKDAKAWVVGTFKRSWSAVKEVLAGPVRLARDAIRAVIKIVRTIFSNVKDWVLGAFKREWAGLKAIFTNPVQAAKNVFQNILGPGGAVRRIFKNVVTAVGGIWNGIKGAMSGPVNWVIKNVINRLIGAVNTVAGKLGMGNVLKKLSTVGGGGGGGPIPSNPGKGPVGSFARGGFTGRGGKYAPAGIVHRGEFVHDQETTKRARPLLDALHKTKGRLLPGYAKGGPVVWPVPGHDTGTYPGHDGVDINRGSGSDDYGDPIRAFRSGRISYVGWGRGYGRAIFEKTAVTPEVVYGHTSAALVRAGQMVRAGQLIGRVGSTGHSSAPHLHFGVPGGTTAQALGLLRGATGGGGGLAGAIGNFISMFNPLNAIKGLLGKIGITGVPGGAFGRMIAGGAKNKLVQGALDWAKSKIGSIFSTGQHAPIKGSPRAIARAMLGNYPGWGPGQFAPLDALWNKESGWDPTIHNGGGHGYIGPHSAYGIPQALPGSKMASAGRDWRTNPATQIRWGLGYIKNRYGSPAAAWRHSQATGWYDQGGLARGIGVMPKRTIAPERVLSPQQTESFDRLTRVLERNGGTMGGPLVNIQKLVTHDEKAAAREIEERQRRALMMARASHG